MIKVILNIENKIGGEEYNKEVKTNAMRILERENISYTLHTYEIDENNLDAITAAERTGLDKRAVFKTISLINEDNNIFIFSIPSYLTISLKEAKKVTNSRDIEPVKMKDLLSKVGYIRGSVSPLGLKKTFPYYIEESCLEYDKIYVSAGKRGNLVGLSPNDLIKLTNAKTCNVAI